MKKPSFFPWPNLLALALCLGLGAGCTDASKARSRLASADRNFKAQKYDDAEIEYESVLRLISSKTIDLRTAAIRQLGFIYFEEGRQRKAFQYLNEALKREPQNKEVQLKLAEIYGTSGLSADLKKGVELLESVLHAEPGNEHALTLLAEMWPTNGLSSLGQRLETQLREGGQGAAACHSALGWIDLRLHKLTDAEAQFKQASTLDPKLASPYVGQAELCFFRQDTKGRGLALKTAAELSPMRSAAPLKYADFKMEIGAADEAKEIVGEITRQAPDYIPAWLFLMKVALAEHKYDDCKTIIDKILARDQGNFDAMLESGLLPLAQSNGPKAVSAFQHMYQAYTNAPVVKYELARAYLMNNENQKAAASLHDALTIDRDYSPAVLLLAELDNKLADLDNNSGKLSEAAALLTPWVKKHPDDALAQMALAETYLAQGQSARALEVYQQMAQVFPVNPDIQRRIGIVYAKEGDSAKARAAFEKSLTLGPAFLPTLQEINALDISEKRFEEAHRRVAKVMADNPKAAAPLMLEGDIDRSEGRTNQAESAYSKAIELNPELSTAYTSLAQLYLSTHQEQQALDRLNALVSKHTNDVGTLMTIGMIHQAAGRYEQAQVAYEKVLAVDSNSFSALNNLAYVDSEFLGKVDKALELAQRAKNLRPDDPHADDTLGWILFKKRDYAHALSAIKQGAETQANDLEVQMHLGMAYYMMGQEKPARINLQSALAGSADYPGKDLARRALAILEIDPATASPEAIQKLQARVHDNPQEPAPLSRLADIQIQHGETQNAIQSLQALLSINPQDWAAMIRLARLYADSSNDLRKALELAKSAHSLAPDDGHASALLGELVYRSGDYPWSLSLLEEAAHQVSDQPSLFYHLALAYYAGGRVTDADAAMQKAVQLGDTPVHQEQAKQFLALREAVKDSAQAQAASAQVKEILAKDPNNVPALMVSGRIAEGRGEVNEAEQIYQKALSIYQVFTPAMRQLALLYSHSQLPADLDKAYGFAEKARAALPNDLELAKALGILAYGHADYNRSMLLLQEYTGKAGDDAEAFYYLGMDNYKLKQTNPAKQALHRALALHLSETLAGKAQGVLKELK